MTRNKQGGGVRGGADGSKFFAAAIVILAAGGCVLGWFFMQRTSRIEQFTPNRVISVLFAVESEGKLVSAFVFFGYAPTRRGVLFDIPGNTAQILKTKNRFDRIDSVYDSANIAEYEAEVERLIGNTLSSTMVIEAEGLGALVDIMNGVEVDIPSEALYNDDGFTDALPIGRVTLDGSKTRLFFRSDDDAPSDARISLRENLFVALLKKIGEKWDDIQLSALKKYFYSSFRTTLKEESLARLFEIILNINFDTLRVQSVAGDFREIGGGTLLVPYYNGDTIKDVVKETLNMITRNRELGSGVVFRVEILNGTTTAGLAARTSELLRGFGYDVVKVANADSAGYGNTFVIDRSGAAGEGDAFASIIRCTDVRKETEPEIDANSFDAASLYRADRIDFTLVLGWDFNGRFTTK